MCYAHEFETNPLQTAEVIAFLNGLLEGERAGAQGLIDMSKTCNDAALKQLLLDVARDEGRYCVMLRSHVQRLGGTPTDVTGVFYEKLMAREGLAAQLKLLDRGQSAVVRMIDETMPRIADARCATTSPKCAKCTCATSRGARPQSPELPSARSDPCLGGGSAGRKKKLLPN